MKSNSPPPLTRLLHGNARFAAGKPRYPRATADRLRELTGGQNPFALVLSCSDSRVPPEIIFDQGLGDIFTVRTAGHVLDDAVTATLAFGIAVLRAPLVVVLGHEQCGAVTAALQSEGEADGPLAPLLEAIRPALAGPPRAASDADGLEAAVKANVGLVVSQVRALAASLVEEPGPDIVGAYYRLGDGRIELLDGQGETAS